MEMEGLFYYEEQFFSLCNTNVLNAYLITIQIEKNEENNGLFGVSVAIFVDKSRLHILHYKPYGAS